jgi:hypothetical protein
MVVIEKTKFTLLLGPWSLPVARSSPMEGLPWKGSTFVIAVTNEETLELEVAAGRRLDACDEAADELEEDTGATDEDGDEDGEEEEDAAGQVTGLQPRLPQLFVLKVLFCSYSTTSIW